MAIRKYAKVLKNSYLKGRSGVNKQRNGQTEKMKTSEGVSRHLRSEKSPGLMPERGIRVILRFCVITSIILIE